MGKANVKNLPERLRSLGVPVLLLAVTLLSYGLLFRSLGFYWDDFPFAWIAAAYGRAGLARYFSTNRPFWGLLYQLSTSLIPTLTPWPWQLFGLFWRWISALAFWLLVRRAWPERPRLALSIALLFLVYPGFGQQPIGLMYGHFFIVFSALLFSFYASLRAAASPHPIRRGAWLCLALLLSLLNLLTMEYFFLLELLRPLLLWMRLPSERRALRQLVRNPQFILPLLLFFGVGIWRAFFFPYQTQNYQPALNSILTLPGEVLRSLWVTGVGAWLDAFQWPGAEQGRRVILLFAALVGFSLPSLLALLWKQPTPTTDRGSTAWQPVILGAVGLLVAGGPFWLTGLPPGLTFPNDRFTLPFMPGSSLILAGLLQNLPQGRPWGRWLARLTLPVLLSFAIGAQFLNANTYRRDWITQRSLFWQLSWRAPSLQPGTTLFSNDLPMRAYSDNSLTAPLNWIYSGTSPKSALDYLLLWPSVREGSLLKSYLPGQSFVKDYLVAPFNGSTDQVVAFYFNPPACLRVIDPQIERDNQMLPAQLREAAILSDAVWIGANPTANLPVALYGNEPEHGWCYYFERADLARQQGDWQTVAALGDAAFALGDYPNDPAERMPFIEGYAHVGRWAEAVQLTQESLAVTPLMQPPLCALWQRISLETPNSPEQQAAQSALPCPSGK
jgi:hypothetical protein